MDEEIEPAKVPWAFYEGKKTQILVKNGPKIMKLLSYQAHFKHEVQINLKYRGWALWTQYLAKEKFPTFFSRLASTRTLLQTNFKRQEKK